MANIFINHCYYSYCIVIYTINRGIPQPFLSSRPFRGAPPSLMGWGDTLAHTDQEEVASIQHQTKIKI